MEGYSRRPQLQKRLTAQVAYTLHEGLRARGAIVVGEADHVCMTVRGPETGERDRHQRRTGHLRQEPAHLSGGHEPHNRPTLTGSVERRGPYEPPDLRGDGNFAQGLSCLASSGLS